jgi:hypothetical protein
MASLICDHDSDGDGNAEATAVSSVSSLGGGGGGGAAAASYARYATDSNSDGDDDCDALMAVTPTTSSMAIKTKGTGADKNRVVATCSTGTGGMASLVCDHDSDGDGVPESEISNSVTPTTSSMAIKTKGTGAEKNRSISSTCDTTGARLAIKTKGTSAKRLSAGGDCDDADAVLYVDCDDDNDGVAERSVRSNADDSGSTVTASEGGFQVSLGTRKGWDGTIKGRIAIDNGADRTIDLDSDGDGYFAGKVGIGVDVPTHRIDVAGGAFCDGSNWVNASDASLKENFSEVNGEELLSKIDELTVTEWNYKNDNQNVKHIGPTAQDFQKTFGVGSDGKSISTIDPSGIALAAIKALNKQNQELKDQNSHLQKRLDDLQNKVEKLISRQ